VAEQPAQQTADGPGRYQRSIGGGVGAMVVLVVLVLAFVVLRSCTRDNPDVTPEAVDYLSAVGPVEDAGLAAVYPPSLPNGWKATSIDFVPGERPAWGIGMLTDDGLFVGIRQADADLSSMLETYVDADAVQGDTVTVPGALTEQWQEWSDAGGDHAYSASLGDTEVLVYGTAPTEDLLTIVGSLTDAPAPAG
jgi:Protein of unknown function (DUF4245)